MLAKLAQTAADQIARIQEELPFGERSKRNIRNYSYDDNDNDNDDDNDDDNNDDNNDDGDDTLQSLPPKADVALTTSGTSIQFLKKLRSPSIVSQQTTSKGSSLASIGNDSIDSSTASMASSVSDSLRCNNANMPNKITGEMGVEIFPSPDQQEEIIFKYVHDRHFQYIQPNVFGPACLVNAQRMGGGGSGVSVFSATHPRLGEIVMKHGGAGDMKELFALGTIAAQLQRRGTETGSVSAMKDMQACLPEFKMVYISPQHVLYKPKAVWGKLKKLVKIGRDRRTRDSFAMLAMKIEMSEHHIQSRKSTFGSSGAAAAAAAPALQQLVTFDDSKFLGPGANIRIYECDSGIPKAFIEDCHVTEKPALNFVVPKDHIRSIDNTTLALDRTADFDSLQHLYEALSPLMSKHLFKFTLAQKRIGGPRAKTGSQWLYEGKLDGLVLGSLIARFIVTVRDLQALTLPEEVNVVDEIRREVQQLRAVSKEGVVTSDAISEMADQFMGNAIKKNFHPQKGRMRFLRKTCQGFREKDFYLLDEELVPAGHLATLGEPDAHMSDVFVGASSEPPLFHPDKDMWLNLMAQATSSRPSMSPNATKRVWTSGLCDAGIHNLFVSKDDLYFFDLGVPQLQSLPGFMTKFLFSFFHILGMEEDKNSSDNEWVRRFVPQGDKLVLTKETTDLLPRAYDAFEVSLSRIIEEVFDGDQSLRWLLLQYVTLQLLSDASFCLQRWSMKGGGHPREDDNHNRGLERWLWRALWDTYVAFDINTQASWERLKVEHQDHSSLGEELRASIRTSINDGELHELLELDKLVDDQQQQESESHGRNSGKKDRLTPSSMRKSSLIRRNSSRWSSVRLSLSTLRELSVATFEHTAEPLSDTDDEDDSDSEVEGFSSSEFTRSSLILPSNPKRYSLQSMEDLQET